MRDARAFLCWLDGREPTKELTVCYKGRTDRAIRGRQRQLHAGGDQQLPVLFRPRRLPREAPARPADAVREPRNGSSPARNTPALSAPRAGRRSAIVMQAICGTGIRVSELRHITAEAVREGRAAVRNKGKTRVILIPAALRKLLLRL